MAAKEDGTQQRILEAAGEIFAEHGYERATIREIISRASVNLAAVNYHFGDKEKLYRATIRRAHVRAIELAPFPEWEPGTPPQVRLRAMIHVLLQRMLVLQNEPWQSRLMMREFFQPTGACQELVEDFFRPQQELMIDVIRVLAPAETPEWKLWQYVFSIVGQGLLYKLANPINRILVGAEDFDQHFSPTQLADHIADGMLAVFAQECKPVPSAPASNGKRAGRAKLSQIAKPGAQ